MSRDNMVIDSEQLWAIDLKWLQENNRSLTMLAKGALCIKCRKKLKIDKGEVKASELLKSLKNCCGKSPDFITPNLPLQESTFRAFLANGNEPMSLDELGKQLSDRRGVDAYRTSSAILSRLLAGDNQYGLRQVQD